LGDSDSFYSHKVVIWSGVSAIIILKGTPVLGFDCSQTY
jgi:hypothetical protein